ncbi:MAG TPA: hypothetical protein VF158_03590 [Longimicrobiales bacterium]
MHPWIPILVALQLGAAPSPDVPAPIAAPAPPAAPVPPTTLAGDTVPPRDAWFAEDKLRHFFLSFAATSVAYGAARTAGLDHGPAEVAAGVGAAAAGVWKEFHDRSLGRPFSRKDLVWDGLGILAAVVLATQTR